MIARPDIDETDSRGVRFTVTEVEIKYTNYSSVVILGLMENTTGIDQMYKIWQLFYSTTMGCRLRY